MDERQIEQLARRLGTERAERLDVDATVAAVLAGARRPEDVARRDRWEFHALRAAAAVILIVGSGLVLGTGVSRDSEHRASIPTVLERLAPSELAEVLDSLDAFVPVSELVSTDLADLSERELQELLAFMEG